MNRKRVLFIGIGFYDYDQSIIEQLRLQNFEVDYFNESPGGFLYLLSVKFSLTRGIKWITEQKSRSIALTCGNKYDVVFIIKCEYLTKQSLELLKNKNPNAKFILYLWDSIERIPKIEEKIPYFSKVYSFDRLDCLSRSNLTFNPLFYRDNFNLHSEITEERQIKYHIYFLGWYHSDRMKIVKTIINYCKLKGLRYKIAIYTGYLRYILDTLLNGDLKNQQNILIFKPLTVEENLSYINSSHCVIDIAHPKQSGLTMRTIELLGANKKLITTNGDIINYDFYHPNNILVIDRENPVLNESFFKAPYEQIPEEIKHRYTLKAWITRMIH